MTSSDNLSQEQTERIRAEEFFRVSIRKEIEHLPPRNETINFWHVLNSILNSNFCLWLLSAVFISGFGTIYTNLQNAKKESQQIVTEKRIEQKKRDDRIDRLSMEFSYRLSNALIKLESASRTIKTHPNQDKFKLRLDTLSPLSNL